MGRTSNLSVAQVSEVARRPVAMGISETAIQHLEKTELLELQTRLGLGTKWGVLEIPADWLPPGVCQGRHTRQINIRAVIEKSGAQSECIDACLRRITQYALICFLVPNVGRNHGAILLTPATISSAVRTLCGIVLLCLDKSTTPYDSLISRIELQDFGVSGPSLKERAELNRVIQFTNRGLWHDCPSFEEDRSSERSRWGNDHRPTKPPIVEPFQPFSDSFTSEAGWRMAWIVEHLGSVLIECAEEIVTVYKGLQNTSQDIHALESKRSHACQIYLRRRRWTVNGDPLVKLPFEFGSRGQGRFVEPFAWPPKTHSDVKALLGLLQTAHLFVFLLSTGGRISEALSLVPGCVVMSDSGSATVNGRTYKLVFQNDGVERDWPLPELGVLAIQQQERLCRVSEDFNLNGFSHPEQKSMSTIWRRIGTGQPIQGDYNEMLDGAVESLGLGSLLGDSRAHAHRFRKTIARLIALALVDAPKILMDLFGHKSIEMTLRYILTDPSIRAEMEEVIKAQTIIFAEDAIASVNNAGGPAATRIKAAVDAERVRLGKEFQESDLKSLAETFTLSGKFWQLVRPGVICTKLPQQTGPCNKNVGFPEPSRCRSSCDYRFESAALRDDVDQSIASAVTFLVDARNTGDEMAVEMWTGQILANIDRFPDLQAKWESDPEVSRCLLAIAKCSA
jgi:integrase